MRRLFVFLFVLFSVFYTFASRATPTKSKASETRLKQQAISKSLYAKLKAQALNEARAELAREQEQREKAKLEALEELNAGASETPAPVEGGEQ